MLRGIVSVAVVLGLSIAAQAAITASVTSQATTGLSGYTTYSVTLTTDTDLLASFDISFNGSMNQVSPSGNETIFLPENPSIYIASTVDLILERDSHFLFRESQLTVVGSSSESGTSLAATFAFPAGTNDPMMASSINIAQIVIADGNTVEITGVVAVAPFGGSSPVDVTLSSFTIPEPASISLLAIGGLALLRRRSR